MSALIVDDYDRAELDRRRAEAMPEDRIIEMLGNVRALLREHRARGLIGRAAGWFEAQVWIVSERTLEQMLADRRRRA